VNFKIITVPNTLVDYVTHGRDEKYTKKIQLGTLKG
jgi:hypothetical protein